MVKAIKARGTSAILIFALSSFFASRTGLSAGAPATLPPDGTPYEFETSEPVVMCGDIHGDLDALVTILRHAGLVDLEGHWIGGKTLFLSPGDILDGDKESLLVVNYLTQLHKEAQAAGGDVITTNGNHEIMVSEGDVLHVTPEEAVAYQNAEAEEHEENSIHEFLDPENARGQYLRSINEAVKITQKWKEKDSSGKLMERSKTFIAVHAGFDKTALKIPLSEYNSTVRAWIKYWQYKARTLRELRSQIKNNENLSSKFKKKLEKDMDRLKQDELPIVDENGTRVRKPPNDTAWVVGYDPKSQTFDRSAPRSPSWARFNRIELDPQTGQPIDTPNPWAMTPAEMNRFLKKEKASFMVVGHEPNPADPKRGIIREPRWVPQYPQQVLNMDTRIGWALQKQNLNGTISYVKMEKGEIQIIPDIPHPRGPTRTSVRMAQATTFGIGCRVKQIVKYLDQD